MVKYSYDSVIRRARVRTFKWSIVRFVTWRCLDCWCGFPYRAYWFKEINFEVFSPVKYYSSNRFQFACFDDWYWSNCFHFYVYHDGGILHEEIFTKSYKRCKEGIQIWPKTLPSHINLFTALPRRTWSQYKTNSSIQVTIRRSISTILASFEASW